MQPLLPDVASKGGCCGCSYFGLPVNNRQNPRIQSSSSALKLRYDGPRRETSRVHSYNSLVPAWALELEVEVPGLTAPMCLTCRACRKISTQYESEPVVTSEGA
jgi:hypothetical protein